MTRTIRCWTAINKTRGQTMKKPRQPTPDRRLLPSQFRGCLRSTDLTVLEVALQAGVPLSRMEQIAEGRIVCDGPTIDRIAKIFRVWPQCLYEVPSLTIPEPTTAPSLG